MATKEEKETLAKVVFRLADAARTLKKQAPAIRDTSIRAHVEYVQRVIEGAHKDIDEVIGE